MLWKTSFSVSAKLGAIDTALVGDDGQDWIVGMWEWWTHGTVKRRCLPDFNRDESMTKQ